jgi:hypothetical protein
MPWNLSTISAKYTVEENQITFIIVKRKNKTNVQYIHKNGRLTENTMSLYKLLKKTRQVTANAHWNQNTCSIWCQKCSLLSTKILNNVSLTKIMNIPQAHKHYVYVLCTIYISKPRCTVLKRSKNCFLHKLTLIFLQGFCKPEIYSLLIL